MGTGGNQNLDPEQDGILPRVFKFIFEEKEKRIRDSKKENPENNIQIRVYISFLEIYNEELIDLLADEKPAEEKKKLNVREKEDKTFFVEGLS